MKIYILINGRESVRLSNVVPMRHVRGAGAPHCKTNDVVILNINVINFKTELTLIKLY